MRLFVSSFLFQIASEHLFKDVQMVTLPVEMIALLAAFAPEFSKPVWMLGQVLLVGAILSPHKRTVTAALRAMGLSQEKGFDKYHRVLQHLSGWLIRFGHRFERNRRIQ